jgi:hypothetical protein
MITNRTSPKKPLIAAFAMACLSVLYALGFRGRYHPSVAPLSFYESARLFVIVLSVSFVIFYPLRMLGVHMGPIGGKEDDKQSGRKSDAS